MAAAQPGRSIPDFEIQQLHHPPVHQKLQLVSQDVRYLQKLFLDAAKNKIDTHLPEREGARDPLKTETEDLVKQYVLRMFELAKHSLVVNGLDGADPSLEALMRGSEIETADVSEKYEPFDLELNEEVRQLYAQIDEETVEVTKLRREAPLRVVKRYNAELEMLKEQHEVIQNNNDEIQDNTEDMRLDDILPRREAYHEDFDKLIETLKDMKKTVPLTVSKLDRAEAALMHLEQLNKSR